MHMLKNYRLYTIICSVFLYYYALKALKHLFYITQKIYGDVSKTLWYPTIPQIPTNNKKCISI